MPLIAVGFGYHIPSERVVAVLPYGNTYVRSFLKRVKGEGRDVINMNRGRETLSVICLDDGTVCLCHYKPENVSDRVNVPRPIITSTYLKRYKQRKAAEKEALGTATDGL